MGGNVWRGRLSGFQGEEPGKVEMLSKNRATYTIQSVENALCILEAISEEPGDFGVTHLSARLGMEKSYVFRVLATFERRGYVQHVESSGRYRVGLTAYETGSRFLHQMQLLQKAKPIMEHLAKSCGEAIYLAIPGGDDLLFLEMADSLQQVRVIPLVGKRFPMQQFSAGKVILAQGGNDQQVVPGHEACFDHGAVGEGIGSLSVPVLNANGLACASLCLLAPEFRLSHERIEETLSSLLDSAGVELSARLGYVDGKLLQLCG